VTNKKEQKKYPWVSSFLLALVLAVAAAAIYLALDFLFDLPPEGLEFRAEVVRAEPGADAITFMGEYHFFAHHPRRRSYALGFPIYERNGLPPPQEIEVSCNGNPLKYKQLTQGIEYTLPVRPGRESIVTIRYTLPAPQRKAQYITRTANLWAEPVSQARFIIPPGVQSNYHAEGETEALFSPFRPKKNWELRWR
jgi:uncharacterized protein (DUF58 family)